MVKKKFRRKTKKNIEKITLLNKFKEFLKLKYPNIKKIIFKFYKAFIKEYGDKISSIITLLLVIIGYGILINIPAYTFFKSNFNLLTIFSFGIIIYFIKDEFVEWVRRLVAKR